MIQRGITSAPTNWGVDYGQNRQGEIYGNALANTGSQLGNSIMEFAKKKKEREEKKTQDEAAAKMLIQFGAAKDEKEAKAITTGLGGGKNVMAYIQADQDKQQIKLKADQLEQEKNALTAKVEQTTRERNAILEAVQASRQAQAPSAGRMYGPADEGPAATTGSGTPDVNRFMEEAARRGAKPTEIKAMADSMNATNKANKPKPSGQYKTQVEPITGSVIMVPEGGGSPQNLGRPTAEKPDVLKDGAKQEIKRNGISVQAYLLNGKWYQEGTGYPLDITREKFDQTTGFVTKIPENNPAVWGVDAGGPPAPAAKPAMTASADQGAPEIKTKAEYDALPSGSEYIDTDGKRKRKK